MLGRCLVPAEGYSAQSRMVLRRSGLDHGSIPLWRYTVVPLIRGTDSRENIIPYI